MGITINLFLKPIKGKFLVLGSIIDALFVIMIDITKTPCIGVQGVIWKVVFYMDTNTVLAVCALFSVMISIITLNNKKDR
ncbi:hypothetical protein [Priestia megaterium]